ncbi:kinase-like domain-containing protein [Mucor mucedo]|uniref:kinase-like domain-containing protein n=1 Tax=Mucor mucedo TaxID=29922 RepID=UPI002220086E|nr:kinase-like domain-containing protein [Mucor mucedo]KAI7872631.1 kinase-like domain-containing protein [Mucor mucedo]
MGFNVADQFRKWRRNSNQRELPAVDNGLGYENSPTEASVAATVAIDPSLADKNPKKLRKPPAKQYPPSPDTYLNGIGDYTFIRQVGQGKFSKVMLSYHCLTRKQVAVKIIDKRVHDYRVMSRLVREISLMEVLEHPNIVRLYETYETTDSLYLVMEYVEGFNLDEYLQQKGGRINEAEARDIFRQMAAAMDYCHSKWVVHRDLKAPNILLTKDFQVKIADFGLGNRFGRRRLKTICGSMLYYSPEIINGQGYTGPEVDCWCLGVSLYRMTVGEEPFSRANTVGDLRKDVTAGQYVIPSYLSTGLNNTIKKCMSIDKTKRTRVHLALKDDPWLTGNGTLPDIFSYNKLQHSTSTLPPVILSKEDELARLKKEKERLKFQHMRDMEDEKRSKKFIKRTIICHPKNPSIYFTSAVPHSAKPEDKYTNSETQRHLLFQKINEISHQIQLSSTQNAGKSPIRHLLRKLKQPENVSVNGNTSANSLHLRNDGSSTDISNTSSSGNASPTPTKTIVRKSTSNMSLSQLYQRVTKDQIHYYTFQLTPQTAMRLTGIAESSFSLQHTQQDEFTMMLIIRGICDIMGITYHRDKNDHLICVMALSDYINEKPRSFYKLRRRDSKIASSNQSLSGQNREGSTGSQQSFSRSSAGDMNRSSYFGSSRFSKFKRMTSNVLSSIFPYHSSTLVVQDSRSVRYPPFPTLNRPGSSQSSQNSQTTNTNNNNENENQDGEDKKSGVAIFAIEIISLSKDSIQNRITAIKISKIEGSSKVFRIACGWLTGAIGQNITPAQLSDTFNNLTATIHGSSTDIPNMILQQQQQQAKRLSRPKSVANLLHTQPVPPIQHTCPSPPHLLDSPPSSSGQFEVST